MAILSELKNLTHLDLPDSSSLSLGFDGGPECGNAYDGEDGREYGRQVTRQRAETTEMAGNIVMMNIPHLLNLTIGEMAPNITRAENGTVSLIWPWTGGMDDWVMEIWPEMDDYDDITYGGMEEANVENIE